MDLTVELEYSTNIWQIIHCIPFVTYYGHCQTAGTCHTAVSDSRRRHFYMVSGTIAQCEFPFNCALEIILLPY